MTLTSPSNQASSSFLINLVEDSLTFVFNSNIVGGEGTFITSLKFFISNWFTQCRPILVARNLLLGGGWRSSQHIVVLKKKNGRYSDISQIDKLASVAAAANLPNFNFNFQQIIKTRTALHPLDWIKVKSG